MPLPESLKCLTPSGIKNLPLISKILLIHGLSDITLPNVLTALPLLRVLDVQHRSKKKRGWAWFFLMTGLMKIHSAIQGPLAAANGAGWAYGMQTIATACEGFWHGSVGGNHPQKVLGGNICFNLAMWVWIQVAAVQHIKRLAPRISANGDTSSQEQAIELGAMSQ
mmetsp:Transcript_42284/g.66992  ORF Transcript_42284/g.66992 Transcript_42284/m.66992 type:complete len:166 (+) Transcript_42284:65-562(+)